MKTPTIEKIISISIWFIGILKISWANNPTIKKQFPSMHHQDNMHLQLSMSTW
jgi:hypothetical protein